MNYVMNKKKYIRSKEQTMKTVEMTIYMNVFKKK